MAGRSTQSLPRLCSRQPTRRPAAQRGAVVRLAGLANCTQQQAPARVHGDGRNSMRLIRLLPLVVLFAFGAFITGQAQPALATLNTFTLSTPTAGVGQEVRATGSLLNIPAGSTI